MPAQDDEPTPEGYRREWIDDATQRKDESNNLMFEKQLKRDIKKGIPATPILNFPAGGYWKYIKITPDATGDPPVKYAVPGQYTDFNTKKDYRGKRGGTGEFKAVGAIEKSLKKSKEYLDKVIRENALEVYRNMVNEEDLETEEAFSRESRFNGQLGYVQSHTIEGGVLPGTLADTTPQGHYWKRDNLGNDIWKDGRRVPAPLMEGKGLTRPGKVAGHLDTYGRGGMYGGKEKISQQLEEHNTRNLSYMRYMAEKYAPLDGTEIIPQQTPEGEEDKKRKDGTRLTRDWTYENLQSIDPHDYTMADPMKYWWKSSEGRKVSADREKEFNRWANTTFLAESVKYRGGPFEGKALHWTRHLGVKYGATKEDWARAKGAKADLLRLWNAEHIAKTNRGLDVPGTTEVDGLAVQLNGVVLDPSARPTGEVMVDEEPIAEERTADEVEEMNVEDFELSDSDDPEGADDDAQFDEDSDPEFEDDGDTFGRRITSKSGGGGLAARRNIGFRQD